MNFLKGMDEDEETPSRRSELIENLEVLRRLPIFSEIPFEIIKLYAYTARRRQYRTDEFLFRQGQLAQEAFLVLSGKIRLLMAEVDGRMLDLQVLDPGDFFGYMSLLAEYEWPLATQALSAADVLVLDRHSFRKILVRYPEKGLLIVERLVQMRMARMKAHMSMLMQHIEDKSQLIDLYRIDAPSG